MGACSKGPCKGGTIGATLRCKGILTKQGDPEPLNPAVFGTDLGFRGLRGLGFRACFEELFYNVITDNGIFGAPEVPYS